ncbi:MAG: hypothetical protein GX970_00175 [Phyllobacteriaceae bacterium]|nr:hypothetical protein [Phyllobacteriaceae bacterium]
MKRILLPASVLLFAALPIAAQEHQGRYSGEGEGQLEVDLTHIEDDRYAISISTVMPISEQGGGCAGGIDGEVLLSKKGGNFFVENEDFDPALPASGYNQRMCEISLKFSKDGTLEIEEREGCLYYHGAACGFTGTLVHDAAGL